MRFPSDRACSTLTRVCVAISASRGLGGRTLLRCSRRKLQVLGRPRGARKRLGAKLICGCCLGPPGLDRTIVRGAMRNLRSRSPMATMALCRRSLSMSCPLLPLAPVRADRRTRSTGAAGVVGGADGPCSDRVYRATPAAMRNPERRERPKAAVRIEICVTERLVRCGHWQDTSDFGGHT